MITTKQKIANILFSAWGNTKWKDMNGAFCGDEPSFVTVDRTNAKINVEMKDGSLFVVEILSANPPAVDRTDREEKN